jgi:alanine racemase
MSRPTRAIINLDALRHNFSVAQALGGAAADTIPVVKANAYGHGALAVAKALEPLAPALAVACIEEAVALRDAGIACPILLLEGFFSDDELDLAAAHNFWLMVQNDYHLRTLEQHRLPRPVTCWIKLDTGMHRLGFEPERARDIHERLGKCPQVGTEIVMATHFASADALDSDFTTRQIALFREHTRGIDAPCSLANSPGLLGWPSARAEWNRPGLMLYGLSPFDRPHAEADRLQPVMSLHSRVMAVREVKPGDSVGYANAWTAERPSRIATVPVGYGDGYPRNAPNGTPVMVNGQRARLAGRVSMDMITVDVTDLPAVQVGDDVSLWGEGVGANELAAHASTIGYEIVTRTLSRVAREYI